MWLAFWRGYSSTGMALFSSEACKMPLFGQQRAALDRRTIRLPVTFVLGYLQYTPRGMSHRVF